MLEAPVTPLGSPPTPSGRTVGSQTDNQGRMDVYGTPFSFPGFSRAWSGIYRTYRLMMAVPTVAMLAAASKAVMKSAEWSVETGDDAPYDAADLIQDSLVKNRAQMMNDMFRAITYGNQPFEKVWKQEKGAWVIDRLKPLLPDLTTQSVDKGGEVVELTNGGARLGPEKFFYLTYDAEAGNIWGRSRLENMRTTAHRAWKDTIERFGQYMTKTAGVIPMIFYPPGQSRDANGNLKDSFDIAKQTADELSKARAIVCPLIYDSQVTEMLLTNPEAAKLLAWRFEMLETKGQHHETFLGALKWAEQQMCRGYLWPERAIIEGQFGTKAEAGVHQDLGVEICYQDTCDFLYQMNKQVVDDILDANYGPYFKGKVWLQAAPLSDEAIAFQREIVKGVLTDPNNADIVPTIIDFDAAVDNVGLPKAKSTIELQPTNPTGGPIIVGRGMPSPAPAPAAPTFGGAGGSSAPMGDTSVAQQALNGIQITSLRELVEQVVSGNLPEQTAKNIAYVSFPAIPQAEIDRIFESVRGFKQASPPTGPLPETAMTRRIKAHRSSK